MNLEQFNVFKSSPKFNIVRYVLGLIAEMEVLDTLREYFEDGTIFPLPGSNQFDYYYVFKYVNGLYYWKYDSKLFLRQGKINGIDHYFIDVREIIK